ncbi:MULTISPECIES: DUF4407 domain-containing protein [Arenibacter]|uniref:DUF4407 domain-containing protein n=1 Tax=Arenibacter TaxID=178469 RepID=UPI0013000B6C|nr:MULTISPECIES: DUF4407 domain-containing protein [Arenibacter]
MHRFLDNKKLWWFAGEDPYILGQCSKSLRRTFSIVGILVVIISLLSAASLAYGVHQILESTSADIIIGIYCGLFVFVLYLFLLHTLSRNVLPTDGTNWRGNLASYIIRIGFLIFLGFLVAQPVSYLLFEKSVENELVAFKTQEILNVNRQLNIKYAKTLSERKSELKSKNQILSEIENNNRLKNRELRSFIRRQEESNFFIRKILILNTLFHFDKEEHADINVPLVISSWALSLFLIFIFITPAILKILISISSEYYIIKKTIETKLIDTHFNKFLNSYNGILQERYPEKNLSYSSQFIDPPYNTRLKSKPELKNRNDFLKWLLDESN